jgi:hypothetical protein
MQACSHAGPRPPPRTSRPPLLVSASPELAPARMAGASTGGLRSCACRGDLAARPRCTTTAHARQAARRPMASPPRLIRLYLSLGRMSVPLHFFFCDPWIQERRQWLGRHRARVPGHTESAGCAMATIPVLR